MFQTDCICDYKIKNMEFIRNIIKKRVDEGKKQFAILPMGFWGKKTKSLLENEFKIKPKACFDNFIFDNQEVYSINDKIGRASCRERV